jgi:hypothetical protein
VSEAVTVFAGPRSPDERFGTVHHSHHLLIDDEVDNSHKLPDKLNIFWVRSRKEDEKTCPLYWVGRRSRSLIRRPSQKCSLLLFELGSRVINNNDSNKTLEFSCNRLQLQ